MAVLDQAKQNLKRFRAEIDLAAWAKNATCCRIDLSVSNRVTASDRGDQGIPPNFGVISPRFRDERERRTSTCSGNYPMKLDRRTLFTLLVYACACSAFGQSPGWSRGQQLLPIGFDDCVRRASQSLQAEGYAVEYAAGAFAVGRKGVHTGVITCNASPDGKQWINVVVASNGEGGGSERERLQVRMEGAPPPIPPPPPPDSGETISWRVHLSDKIQGCPVGTRMSFTCGPADRAPIVIGTDFYFAGSSICGAAAHAGLATFQNGGRFTLEVLPAQRRYTSSVRNKVHSLQQDNRTPECSFRFVNAASARIDPPPNPGQGVTGFLGCFRDTSALDLDGYLVRLADNTPDRCVAICREKGFPFAAVQYGESCLCGRTYGKYGPADNCNMRCTGDPRQACGGHSANSVYGTGVPQ
jgi:hypothetical protein